MTEMTATVVKPPVERSERVSPLFFQQAIPGQTPVYLAFLFALLTFDFRFPTSLKETSMKSLFVSQRARYRVASLHRSLAVIVFSAFCWSSLAQGHFVWLAPQRPATGPTPNAADSQGQTVAVYFSESATPDNPRLLDLLKNLQVWSLQRDLDPQSLTPERGEDGLHVFAAAEGLIVAKQDFGVRTKGDETFRLLYYAKTGPSADAEVWKATDCSQHLELDIAHELKGYELELRVSFQGAPVAAGEVKIIGPDGQTVVAEGETTQDGGFRFAPSSSGRYSIRARHVQDAPADSEDAVVQRHYVTLTLDVPASHVAIPSEQHDALPTTLTSFGGAVLDGYVYVYGGTKGSSHSYSSEVQNDALLRLPLNGGEWETVATGPKLQGLALVPHGGKLYRIGGFQAVNSKGDDHDLWSRDYVACYDPADGSWTDLPALPEPRSSFDAAVLDDTIYVMGGWAMAGDQPRVWHETAWKLDLSRKPLQWEPIATQPFERRALAVAAHAGKIFAIGGITSGDDTVLETDIYDPETDKWSRGPDLRGESGIDGFGTSAFATGGQLYLTNLSGSLQRLSSDHMRWEVVGRLANKRFFHRMLPVNEQAFVMVGGSNQRGRITGVETFKVPSIP